MANDVEPTIESVPPAAPPQSNRRTFLLRLGLVINALAVAAFAVPVIGYLLSPVRRFAWLKWVSLGPLSDFQEQQTRLATYRNPYVKPWDGQTADIPCWVRRGAGEDFSVFAINCTHLGCPVRWFQGAELFMCPCHGGAFYSDGRRASGPPPRGLYKYQYRVADGQLWIKAGQLPTLGQPLA